MKQKNSSPKKNGVSLSVRMWKHRYFYMMLIPAILYVIIFNYVPMYGLQIAFKNFKMTYGYLKSPWVGFQHFIDFFNGVLYDSAFVLQSFHNILIVQNLFKQNNIVSFFKLFFCFWNCVVGPETQTTSFGNINFTHTKSITFNL